MSTIVTFESESRLHRPRTHPEGDELIIAVARAAAELPATALADRVSRLLVNGLPIDTCTITTASEASVGNATSVPLVYRGELVGVLVASRAGSSTSLSFEQRRQLDAVGSVLALALHDHNRTQEAILAERVRIAEDLHDSVGQVITGLGLQIVEAAEEAHSPAEQSRLRDLLALAHRANLELRQAVEGLLLEPPVKLNVALTDLCEEFEQRTGVLITFKVHGESESVGAEQTEIVYRLVHEALCNVERHARAANVSVELNFEGESVTVKIADDGVGVAQERLASQPGHFGIRMMRRRVQDAGGDLHIGGTTSGGACLEAVIPGRKGIEHATSQSGDGR